jgi:hypothetical protein
MVEKEARPVRFGNMMLKIEAKEWKSRRWRLFRSCKRDMQSTAQSSLI